MNYNVPNLERGLLILELLSENNEGLTLTEIINRLDISKSSAFRISNTLIHKNYIQKNERTKKLTLSRKLISMGVKSISELSIAEIAIDYMRMMRDELKESVMLGVVTGSYGTILEQVDSLYPVKLSVEQGTRFPLHSSVGGKSVLAYLPESNRNDILSKMDFKRFTERTITNKTHFEKHLIDVKENGYAIDDAEDIAGIHCVGAPIFNENGFPVACVWITAPAGRLPATEFKEKGKKVAHYAALISNELGFKN